LQSDYAHIAPEDLIRHFYVYLDWAAHFTPGDATPDSRPYVTIETPQRQRWFPIAASQVQTNFPPEIDYWVDAAVADLERQMDTLPLHQLILKHLENQQPGQLSLARALEPAFAELLDTLLAPDDIRLAIGFLAALIPNGIAGLGLIFVHSEIFLTPHPDLATTLKNFFLNTPFAGQFANPAHTLSESVCPYKAFSITVLNKHIFTAVQTYFSRHPGQAFARNSDQQRRQVAELSLIAHRCVMAFFKRLPPAFDHAKIWAVMDR
jgi:hypothetical protein